MGLIAYTSPSQSQTMTGPLVMVADPETAATGSITASGSLQVQSGFSVTSGIKYDSVLGGMPANTSSANIQIFGTSAASLNSSLTMTGSGRVIYVSQSNTSTTTWGITPTASASTSGLFQDGAEVTIVNISASGTSFVLPSNSMGSVTAGASVTISAFQAVRFLYSAALQSWIPVRS